MSHAGGQHPGVFVIPCCGRRRRLLPGGVLACLDCDRCAQIPHVQAGRVESPPDGIGVWRVPPATAA